MGFQLLQDVNSEQRSLRLVPSPIDETVPEDICTRCEAAIKGAELVVIGFGDVSYGETVSRFYSFGETTPDRFKSERVKLEDALRKAGVELTVFNPGESPPALEPQPISPEPNHRRIRNFKLPAFLIPV